MISLWGVKIPEALLHEGNDCLEIPNIASQFSGSYQLEATVDTQLPSYLIPT
jgi:hypothetical protein